MMYANARGFSNGFAGHCFYGNGSGFHMGGIFMMLLLTLLIAFLIYSVYKNNHQNKMSPNKTSVTEGFSPKVSQEILDQLNTKFINGELTEEEYSRKKDLLLK